VRSGLLAHGGEFQLNAMVKSMRTAGLKFNRRASQEAGRMIKASL
jgi:hypothetical protein